jgi:hypothetical protein
MPRVWIHRVSKSGDLPQEISLGAPRKVILDKGERAELRLIRIGEDLKNVSGRGQSTSPGLVGFKPSA